VEGIEEREVRERKRERQMGGKSGRRDDTAHQQFLDAPLGNEDSLRRRCNEVGRLVHITCSVCRV